MRVRCAILKETFADDGFQIVQSLISDSQCDSLATELSREFLLHQKDSKNKIGGVRNLLRNPNVRAMAISENVKSILAGSVLGQLFPVRAVFFDKTPESNWGVPWHQDLAIAVAEKIETPGFAGWSIKDGVVHTHPPEDILKRMVTVRLHLDDCSAYNGALNVIPGSHQDGRLGARRIEEIVSKTRAVICEVPKGGLLLMRPLLLHSSSPAKNPAHRRVLHIEFASDTLPNGLKWFDDP